MYPDAGGARQTFRDMGDQLAACGYAVLVPDVYYRDGDWAPFEMASVFNDQQERKRLFSIISKVTPDFMAADAGAFFDYLVSRPEVSGAFVRPGSAPGPSRSGLHRGCRRARGADNGTPRLR